MRLEEAMVLLGLDPRERDVAAIRTAYLAAIRRTHPDHNAHPDATAEAAQVTVAYRVITAELRRRRRFRRSNPATSGAHDPAASPAASPTAGAGTNAAPTTAATTVAVRVISNDTIEVAAPPDVTFAWLVQTGHLIGDVTFLDRSAALLQILVSFIDEPVCQMIFDLQGRAATGTTEIFCTIDSIEDRPAPSTEAVTRFVAEQLAAVSAAA